VPAREASRPPESTASCARPTADAAWPRKKNRPNRNFPTSNRVHLAEQLVMTKVFIEPRPKKTSLNHPLTYGPPSSSTIARSVQRMGDLASGVT
jgi:hypothetical protein